MIKWMKQLFKPVPPKRKSTMNDVRTSMGIPAIHNPRIDPFSPHFKPSHGEIADYFEGDTRPRRADFETDEAYNEASESWRSYWKTFRE